MTNKGWIEVYKFKKAVTEKDVHYMVGNMLECFNFKSEIVAFMCGLNCLVGSTAMYNAKTG